MTFQPKHLGLYFAQSDIENAHKRRDKREELQTAWQWLLAESGDIVKETKPKTKDDDPITLLKPELTPIERLIQDGLRYRFDNNTDAGQRAVQNLRQMDFTDQATLLETIQHTLTLTHAVEMLRDLIPDATNWLKRFANYSDSLLSGVDDATYLEQLWLITLRIVSGVVLEDAQRFDAGVTAYKAVIDNDLHPEGYYKPLVIGEKESEVTFRGMVLACGALTLAAEASTLAGENLWQYENRDVGVNTAVTYLVYYYFYPAKWRWGDDEITEEQTQAIFAEMGAWLEISTRRVNPRGVELLLEDQRPFFNASMGGLTTLTHYETERRKKRGIFF